MEKVSCFKFLGVNISNDLTWSAHKEKVVKAARKCLFFLRRLKKFGMDSNLLLQMHYREHSDWLYHSVVMGAAQTRTARPYLVWSVLLPALQDTYHTNVASGKLAGF